MDVSLAQTAELTCPQCGQPFTVEIWLLVDGAAQPNLLQRAREGTLHEVVCPHCGLQGQKDAPLLLYLPEHDPPLLFSPAQQTTPEQDREHVAGLVNTLRERLGETWQDAWVEGIQNVPRQMLPVVLAADPEIALREMNEQVAREVGCLQAEDPAAYRQLETTTQHLLAQIPLSETLLSFVQAKTWSDESRCIVEEHPELLGDEADALIAQLLDYAQTQGKENAARILEEQRTLLRRCRETGIAAAFAERAGAAGPPVPEALRPLLQQAQASEQHYLQTNDLAALDASAAAWQQVWVHPNFAESLPSFRLVALNDGANVFLRRYWARGDLQGLTIALSQWETCVALTPAGSPDLPMYLNNLGLGLRARYARTGELSDLMRAIKMHEQAVQQTPTGSPDLPMYLNNLGLGLRTRYARTGELSDLVQAIQVSEQAVQQTPAGFPKQAAMLNSLGNGLYDRYARTGELSDLERAIQVHEQAVQQTPAGSPDLPMYLNNLGLGLRDRYSRTGELSDLARAIEIWEQAVQQTPAGSPEQVAMLNNLGNGLRDRYARTGELSDLERAIEMYEQAILQTPPGSLDLPSWLNNLGTGLRDRYAHTRELSDLARAIQVSEQAVQQTPAGSPNLPIYLNNLGLGLRDRYARTRDPANLTRAIQVSEQAVQQTPAGSPDLPGYLNNLGLGLRDRYARAGELADLKQAIIVWEQAVQQMPRSPEQAAILNNLGVGLRDRYARTGELGDLKQAIIVWEQAVQQTPAGSPELPGYLNNLGAGLRDRYTRTEELSDLARAIEIWEQAVQQMPAGSPEQVGILNNLGAGLSTRYARTGELADLERAIEISEQTVQQTPTGSPDLPGWLNNLGAGLSVRYARTGELSDLERAIKVYEQAVQQTPTGSLNLPMYLKNLGGGLSNRYARTRELGDLDRAIDLYEQAVQQTPTGSLKQAAMLNSLGNGLGDRYARTKELADLKRAIQMFEQAVQQTPAGSPEQAGVLNNLGSGLSARYMHTRELSDLEQAIQMFEQAVQQTPAGSPDLPGYLNNLGNGLRDRYTRKGELANLKRAMASWEQACQLGLEFNVEVSLVSARNWGNAMRDARRWAEAARAYGYGMEAIEQLYRAQLQRRDKELWLRAAQGISVGAAYALTRTGQEQAAVLALETGRARLLSEVLERDRAELDALQAQAPQIYTQYTTASAQLQWLETQELSGQLSLPPGQTLVAALRAARADLDAAIKAIRKEPGYADFLAAPDWEDIAAAVTPDRPLIYLLATPAGGLALLVQTSQTSEVSKTSEVLLDDLTEETLKEHRQAWFSAYGAWKRALWELHRAEKTLSAQTTTVFAKLGQLTTLRAAVESTQAAWFETLETTVDWLRKTVMNNVGAVLQAQGLNRAVLIPMGALGLLPLHAAAPKGVVCSYAPNARALAAAQEIAARSDGKTFDLFAVDDPGSNLPHSQEGVDAVAAHFEHPWVVRKTHATRITALTALRECNVYHFYCHGAMDWKKPLNSGLVLYEKKLLTLRDVLGAQLPGARLAFLSACETNIPDIAVLDEVVALPTGFLQAGVAGVVGTLWAVNDASTAQLAAQFYHYWLEEALPPAEALHRAQCWLRDTYPEYRHPFYWAAFTFTGV